MTREEKILLAIEKGITCNPETGEVFNKFGKSIKTNCHGYYVIQFKRNGIRIRIFNHQFIWYFVNKTIADYIDHIDRNGKNNCITNLRSVSHQENMFNRVAKGYYPNGKNKWQAKIVLNGKTKCLGTYNTEEEAINAFLNAKSKYHNIDYLYKF